MPRTGSGTYTLPGGINPVVNGSLITSSWANTTLGDIATALTNSLAKDGQTVPTGNLPMGGFRHTGVGNPTARDQYASMGFVQDGSHYRLTSINVIGSAITGILVGGDNTYTVGQMFLLTLGVGHGANPTLSVNGGTVAAIQNALGAAIPANGLTINVPYILTWTGSVFSLVNGTGEYLPLTGGTLTGDLFVNKNTANVNVGNGGVVSGGLANYGTGDVGVYSVGPAGTLRLRPDGRSSITGEVRIDTAGLFSALPVFIGSQGGATVGQLRIEDPVDARMGFTGTSNKQYTIGNNAADWTLRDEGLGIDRLHVTSGGRLGINTSPQVMIHGMQSGGVRGDAFLESTVADADGAQIAGVWGRTEAALTIPTEKRTSGINFTLDGTTVGNRGGGMIFLCKLDNSNTMATRWRLRSAGHWEPGVTDTYDIGTGALRVRQYYGTQSTINTSDARKKTPVSKLSEAEFACGRALAQEIGSFQWLEAVKEKGVENARLHIGMTVQRAIEIMEKFGLDPMRYSFICYDKWDERTEPAVMDEIMVKKPVYETREVVPAQHDSYEIEPAVYHTDILRPAVFEDFPVSAVMDDDDNVVRESGFVRVEISPAITTQVLIKDAVMGIRQVSEPVFAEVEVEPAQYEMKELVPERIIPAGDCYSFRLEPLIMFMLAGLVQGKEL